LLMLIILDLIAYFFDQIKTRIERLGCSVRAFEEAKREGVEKKLFIESYAGKLLNLISTKKAFELLQRKCPYERSVSIEHSYYVLWNQHYLNRIPRYRKVVCEYPLGKFKASSDNVAFTHDGQREAFEVTLSTSNILANAVKYSDTDFSRIVFVCRHYQLKEAVKACCREGSLSDDLLQRLDYMQLSSLVRNAKMNS